MDLLELHVADDIRLAVPADLNSISTYVLLEQEKWFEKEAVFLRAWLRPGMTVIDIGANLGIYSLLMARRVGPDGRVFAYEPASEPRALLEHNRALNKAPQIHISPLALSDDAGERRLVFGISSELHSLGSEGAGEEVPCATLDMEDKARSWSSPDLVKIDVEGEEERILVGGRQFFRHYSPLIMVEIKSGQSINERLRAAFPPMGYRLYRQLGGTAILIPIGEKETVDPFELNAFAAKPDRAAALAAQGLLVERIDEWVPDEAARKDGLSLLREQGFTRGFKPLFTRAAVIDPDYRDALAAYAAWRTLDLPAAERCAALSFAFRKLSDLCTRAPTPERLSTLVRVASEWGARTQSVTWARQIADFIQRGPLQLKEPFWPAIAHYDGIVSSGPAEVWFLAMTAGHIERSHHHSSFYTGVSGMLSFVSSMPFAAPEMQRRVTLVAALAGKNPRVPDRLRVPEAGHLNADLWRSGRIPGTVL